MPDEDYGSEPLGVRVPFLDINRLQVECALDPRAAATLLLQAGVLLRTVRRDWTAPGDTNADDRDIAAWLDDIQELMRRAGS